VRVGFEANLVLRSEEWKVMGNCFENVQMEDVERLHYCDNEEHI
jgi:hypothetical protein